ncbi:MAG: LTA synthase family protein [Clostridia bacterium]|nr:LTA synthase family protein [Clostridia bacterium]
MKSFFKNLALKCRSFFAFLKEKVTADDKYRFFDKVQFYIAVSVITTFIIECINRHSFKRGFVFMLAHFYVFLFNALIIFILLLPAFFIKRKVFWTVFIFLLTLGFGIAGGVVTLCRVTPFSMVDILNLKSVLPIIPVYLNVFEIVLFIALIAAAIAFVVFLFIKSPKRRILWKKGLVVTAVSVALFVFGFIFGNNTKILSTDFRSLVNAYDSYGFEYCFAVSVFDRGIVAPKEYSGNKMDEIIDAINKCDNSVPEEKPNVIFVQLESFFEVTELNNVVFSENPIKNFTHYKSEGISGYITVPVIGGGTINTEFEILTGLSLNYFGVGEYPYKTALSQYTCETIPYNLLEIGYSTHALHNYQGSFYRRNEVYRNLGFESFTSIEYMSDVEYSAGNVWPKDIILTDEIFEILHSTDKPDFIFTVSVQPHGKYPPNSLPDDYVPDITAEFIDPLREEGISDLNGLVYYVNQLKETDEFVGELIKAVKAFDEKTIVVFYGDHLPSLSVSDDDLDTHSIYQTPYLIISNYGIENFAEPFGDVEAYRLSSEVLGLLGIHNGLITKLHQNFYGEKYYEEWLNHLEYDMVGYDILGNISPRYVYGGNTEYYPKMDDMMMGTLPIEISDIEYDGSYLIVHGSRFTAYSKIIIGGSLYSDTEFVDSETIRCLVSPSKLASGIRVSQISDNGTELSTTEIVFFEPEE